MKKFTKILCCALGLGFLLAGCATVGNIKNEETEIIYNGNSAVMVNGYLYYGNSFADIDGFSTENDSDYKTSAKLSYLARLNTNVDLSVESKDYSPKNIENVSEEVIAHENSFMFVLGNYIYYATPNRKKAIDLSDNVSKQFFNYTTLYRSKLNGDSKEELYTTNAEISQIEVLKYNGKYYIVFLAGKDLVKIKIGGECSSKLIAEDVESVAIPKTYQKDKDGSSLEDWNGYIYYTSPKTVEGNSDITGSNVNRILISENEADDPIYWNQGTTITFVGRENDQLFYTMADSKTEVYTSNVSESSVYSFINTQKHFYSDSSISEIQLIATKNANYGYIFKTSKGTLCYYYTLAGKSGSITLKNDTEAISSANVMFVSGRTVYLSTETSIYKADLSSVFSGNGGSVDVQCETVVTMTKIQSGNYAFDGTYIYYYAQLEAVETEDEEAEETADETYYLYRTKVSKNSGADAGEPYQLLGRAKSADRRTK